MHSDEQRFEKLLDQLAKHACLMRRMPASDQRSAVNAENDVLIKIGEGEAGGGTWKRMMGKPLAGGILGALAGGAGGYALEQFRPNVEDEDRQPWRRALTGALAGGALGGGIGAASEFKPDWFGGEAPGDPDWKKGLEARNKALGAGDPLAPFLESGYELGEKAIKNPTLQGAGAGLVAGFGTQQLLKVAPKRLAHVDVKLATQVAQTSLSSGKGAEMIGDPHIVQGLRSMTPGQWEGVLHSFRKGNPHLIPVRVPDAVNPDKIVTEFRLLQPSAVGDLLTDGATAMRAAEGGSSPWAMGGKGTPSFTRRLWNLTPGFRKAKLPAARVSPRGLGRLGVLAGLPFLGAWLSTKYQGRGSAAKVQAAESQMRRGIKAGR